MSSSKFPADHIVKSKKSVKIDKCMDFARELKSLLNMKITLILNVDSLLGTVSKGLQKRLEEEIRRMIETIQTIELVRSSRILNRVLETWMEMISFSFLWKAIISRKIILYRRCEKLIIIIIIIITEKGLEKLKIEGRIKSFKTTVL